MTSVNTPLLPDLQVLFDELVAQTAWSATKTGAAPERRWTQFGIPVVTCEELAMGLLNLREDEVVPGAPSCGTVQTADLMVVIGRECGSESEDDGSTDIDGAVRNAQWMDQDTTVLRDWMDGLELSGGTPPSFGYSVEGGIAYTILNLSVKLGW